MSSDRHIKPRHFCNICGKTFKQPYNVKVHKRIHTGERPFQCSLCERAFTHRSSYRAHMKAHESGRLSVVRSENVSQDKIDKNRKGADISCRICHRTFPHQTMLKYHMNIHKHKKATTKTRQNTTDISSHCTDTNHLKKLNALLYGVNYFEFPKHKEASSTAGSKNSIHLDLETDANGETNETKGAEKKSRNSRSVMMDMMKPMTPEQHQTKSNHLNNRNTHINDLETESSSSDSDIFDQDDRSQSKYTCAKCGHSFKSQRVYINHMISHSYEKDWRRVYKCEHRFYHVKPCLKFQEFDKTCYQCKMCKRCFGTPEERNYHTQDFHVLNRPYRCPYCGVRFKVRSNCHEHIQEAHNSTVRILTDKPTTKCIISKSANQTASCAYECSWCNDFFSEKVLLKQHVQTVHLKEKNKVNKMKKMTSSQRKEYSYIDLTESDTEEGKKIVVRGIKGKSALTIKDRRNNTDKRYTCSPCNLTFTSYQNLKLHKIDKHFGDDVQAESERKNIHFKGKNFVAKSNTTPSHPDKDPTSKRVGLDQVNKNPKNKKKELNELILQEYYITHIPKSGYIDPDTNKAIYVCEICSTTYTYKHSLIQHIKNRAYDHGFYLRKKDETGQRQIGSFKSPRPTERFACDVCSKIFEGISNMFSHRQKHTAKEFKDTGVREDVYKSQDGKTIITDFDMNGTPVPNPEPAVSSSTTKEQRDNQSNETDGEDVTVSMEIADDRDFDMLDEEPLYTATPYIDENNENNEFAEHMNTSYETDNTQTFDAISSARISFVGEYTEHFNEQNLKETDTAADIANVMETADGNTMKDTIHADKEIYKFDDIDQSRSMKGIKSQYQTHTDEYRDTTHEQQNLETPETVNSRCETPTFKIINITGATVQIKTPEGIEKQGQGQMYAVENSFQSMNEPEQMCQKESMTMSDQCTNTITSFAAKPKYAACSECRVAIPDGQTGLHCSLCAQVFCINCSGLPRDLYVMIYSNGNECPSGVCWTCNVCKGLVPKFTVLLKQLGDFEQIINNRLAGIEQKISTVRPNIEK